MTAIHIPHLPCPGLDFTECTDNTVDLNILGDFDLSFEIQDLHIANASISPTPPIVQIHNGYVTLAVQDLTLNVTSDYSYISDPPIFADIGEGSIQLSNLTASVDVTSYLYKN